MAEAVRLQRYLAQSGVAARRKSERLMLEGRVEVNGEVCRVLGTRIDPDEDQVSVDGKPVFPEEAFYVVLNKPKGCLTAVSDDRDRRTVMEYLSGLPGSVKPVGRLDYNSEGVLLLTNDGDLSQALQSPQSHAEKTYHVKVKGQLSEPALRTLRLGVRIGPRTVTLPAVVDKLRSDSKHQWLVITLTEGKSRQIHRMVEALGSSVMKLQRVAFAGITFHGLRVGDARELTQAEVNRLYDAVNMPRGSKAVSRGRWSVERETTELDRRSKQRERDQKELEEKQKEQLISKTREASFLEPRARTGNRSGSLSKTREASFLEPRARTGNKSGSSRRPAPQRASKSARTRPPQRQAPARTVKARSKRTNRPSAARQSRR